MPKTIVFAFAFACWAHPWRHSVLRLKEDAESVFTAARMEVAGRMGPSSLLRRSWRPL
jgi:hypothetical protein